MEMFNATIQRAEDKVELILNIEAKGYSICLTDDNPNHIKGVFNELIKALKSNKFNFDLVDSVDDLYFQICTEYIKQLNSELSSVYGQMKAYGLINEKSA